MLTKSLGAEVYGLTRPSLDAAANDGGPATIPDLLAALAAASVVTATDLGRSDTLTGLARALHAASQGDVIATEIHRQSTLLNQFRYEREPGWLLGTHRTRRVLVQGLWIHGSSGTGPVETGSAAAQPFCRAAVLLAAQEGFPFGAATLYWLLRNPRFSERTGWTEKAVTSLRALMDAERVRTGQYVSVLTAAVDAMDPMMRAEKGVDDPNVEVFMDRAEQLAGLSGHRPDVQWRLANLVWRLVNVARRHNRPDVLSRVELAIRRWNDLLAEPAAARWFEEALMAEAPAFRTTGVRRIWSDAFERDYHRVGPEPSK